MVSLHEVIDLVSWSEDRNNVIESQAADITDFISLFTALRKMVEAENVGAFRGALFRAKKDQRLYDIAGIENHFLALEDADKDDQNILQMKNLRPDVKLG